MAWFRKDRKRNRPTRDRLEIPADAWDKCSECDHVDLRERFEKCADVCPQCGFHRRILAREYVELLLDPGSYTELFTELRSVNRLNFEGYTDRLVRAHRKAGAGEGIITGHGTMEGDPVNLGVMEFEFMGASMGSVLGEKIARLAARSIDRNVPLVMVCRSGGARMQEGVLSLMQMAKTSVQMARLSRERIPYISILTDPTTGGVTASFAMQGDVHIAEPGAMIAFSGPRVIKQTIGQDLPDGFQKAEFLMEHGMIDIVIPRHGLREIISRLLRMMQDR